MNSVKFMLLRKASMIFLGVLIAMLSACESQLVQNEPLDESQMETLLLKSE